MTGPDPQRILLVRPSALGDVCRTVPALVSLRQAFPQARIDWLVNDAFIPAVAHHPALSAAVPLPRDLFRRLWCNPAAAGRVLAWMRHLRGQGYDLVVDLQGLLRSGLITRLTGAGRRVGFANAREGGWLGYNVKHAIDPRMHTVDAMLALLEAAGIPVQRDLKLYVGPDDRRWLDGFLAQHDLTGRPYAILAPTAKWRCKCWPIERYVEVARRLLETGCAGGKIIVLASPAERCVVQPLLNAFDDAEELRVILPSTSVGQMLALVSQTHLLIANDSAPLHVGVGFDRPLVAIFGPTDPALVGPYRRPETVLRPPGIDRAGPLRYRHQRDDQTLIAQVTVEDVWRKVQEQLAGADRR